ncbi:MAG: type II toxin-antitoxin system VapC family toxin [Egibacteraceae bacterium]
MRLLLDTHAWLWLRAAPGRLPVGLLALLGGHRNELLLSAASSWEIAITYALGKLPLPSPPAAYVPDRVQRSGVSPLPVEHSHALRRARPLGGLIRSGRERKALGMLDGHPNVHRAQRPHGADRTEHAEAAFAAGVVVEKEQWDRPATVAFPPYPAERSLVTAGRPRHLDAGEHDDLVQRRAGGQPPNGRQHL